MRLRIQQSGPKSLNDAILFKIKIDKQLNTTCITYILCIFENMPLIIFLFIVDTQFLPELPSSTDYPIFTIFLKITLILQLQLSDEKNRDKKYM